MEKQKTFFINEIKEQALSVPEKSAIIYESGNISYLEFVRIYEEMKAFIKANAKPWSRIAVLCNEDINGALTALPIIDYAILIQIDPSLSDGKLNEIIGLLKIDFVLTDSENIIEIFSNSSLGLIKILFNKTNMTLNPNLIIDNKKPDREIISEEDFVSIKTTSGTTNIPKIVPIPKSMYEAAALRYQKTFKHSKDDVVLITTKMHKNLAYSMIARTMRMGGSAVIAGEFQPAKFIKLITEHGVTCFAVPTAMLFAVSNYIDKNNLQPLPNKLRYTRSSGAPLPKKLKNSFEAFFNITLDQSYGMTETFNISNTYNQPFNYREGSAGIMNGLEVRIFKGEILVRGESVFPGYLNEEIDNSEYFSNGWFHTGDLGEIDKDGYIYVKGRIKEMINRGGEKISPYEIESAILQHPDIKEAVVFPYPNEYGSENVGAVIVSNGAINLENLRKFLRGNIPAFKMPTKLFQIEKIPVGSNNKVQRKMLYNELVENHREIALAHKKIRKRTLSKTELDVYKAWKKVLKGNIQDKYATFSDLGGDSLNGAEVISDLEEKYGVKLPVDFLYNEGTLQDIADYIDERKNDAQKYTFLTSIKSTGSKKPLICIHTSSGEVTDYRHLGNAMDMDRPVYAFNFKTSTGNLPEPLDFKSLAAEYANEIIQLDPKGPYYLCGNCWGGVLAFQIACELRSRKLNVAFLAMLDSPVKLLKKGGATKKRSMTKRLLNTIKEGFSQMNERSFVSSIKLAGKKISNIPSLFKQRYGKQIYEFGCRYNIKVLKKLSGKPGALGYAYKKYKPEYFDGRITYFKAGEGHISIKIDHMAWAKAAANFKVVNMNCHHNDIVDKKYSDKLVSKMRSEMEDADA